MDPMESVLHKLYEGEITPFSDYFPKLEAYRSHRRAYVESCSTFSEKLPPELRREFTALMDRYGEEVPTEYESMFLGGFRLGARMMLEVCQGEI